MNTHSLATSVLRARKLSRTLRVPSYRAALRRRVLPATEHERIPFTGEFRTVIDVGANRGQFATVARHLFRDAQLHCFEPLPEPRATLTGVFGGDVRFASHDVGLSDQSGVAEFHVSARDDSSSLKPIGEEQVRAFPGTAEARSITIDVRRLDDVLSAQDLERPVLLKIDVQGAELEVLRGADQVLSVTDEAVIECSFRELYVGQGLADEIVCLMRAAGLRLRGFHRPWAGASHEAIQADLHFVRE